MTDFAKKYDWWPIALRLRVGLLERPQPRVPHMTQPKWNPELIELTQFKTWVLWRHDGHTAPRPDILKGWTPERVYWDVLHEYMVAHPVPHPGPLPPPPPANNPPSWWKNAPWCLPHVHISHGLRPDALWTVDQLIDRCLTYGAKAIFTQLGDDCPDPDWAQHTRELHAAGLRVGIPVGSWLRADYTSWDKVKAAIRSVMPLAGLLADIEGRCQNQQLPEHLRDEFADEMPLGVIATGGIDESLDEPDVGSVAARWGDNFDFVSQAYHKDTLPLTPDSMENFVYWRSTAKVPHGFRHMPDAGGHWQVPVVMPNAEGCPPLADYEPWLKGYAPHFGVWDAELIESNGEWPVFARLARS